jgi:hypothetical protein
MCALISSRLAGSAAAFALTVFVAATPVSAAAPKINLR